MLRPCRLCTHEIREEIDAAILSNVPYKTIAARFRTSMVAILAHQGHLASDRVPAQALPVQPPDVETMLDQLDRLHEQCLAFVDSAAEASDPLGLSVPLGQLRRHLRRLGEMTGQLRKAARKLHSHCIVPNQDAAV